MKTKFAVILVLLSALAIEPAAWAKLKDEKKGGGGRPKISKPGGGGGGDRKKPKAGGGGSGNLRPSGGGDRKPPSKPSGGGGRMGAKPKNRPEQRPQRPSGSGSGLPGAGGRDNKKNQDRPSGRPANKPANKPGGGGDYLGMGGDNRPGGHRPANRPGDGKPNRPGDGNRPNRPGDGNRPAKRPGDGDRPNRPGHGKPNRPGDSDRPNRPNRPDQANRPNRPGNNDRSNRPNAGNRPGKAQRPARQARPEKWQNVQNSNTNQWNKWKQDNRTQINNFQVNRTNNWNNINTRYNQRDWAGHYGSGEYRAWSNDVWDYRRDRCEEVWDRREDFWDDNFDNQWWSSCSWRSRPFVGVGVGVSPWWWWRPFAWAGAGTFLGASLASQPINYDPGTTVIYEGDNYYVDGQPSGTATQARQAAIQLATPAVAEIPVPEPAAEGQPEEWMPLGVWALTQQEQGDATMFMQFSVNREGLLAGAYKNVLTGDEQPIVGQVDTATQRVAWHVGDATQTVYETGLSGLDSDVVSVFVHFGEAQTQTWLLVRLPSPEIPPGTVKLPDQSTQ